MTQVFDHQKITTTHQLGYQRYPQKNPLKKCVDAYPHPKNPQRRNGLDWHGLQRCGINSSFRNVFKKATLTQTFRIVRNTLTSDLYDFRGFVALWRQI